MSVSFSNFVPPQCGHFVPAGRMVSDSEVDQASAPERAKSSTTLRLMAWSLSGLPQPSHRNTAIGTPHTRWREMHQSGRVWIMLEGASCPHAGCRFFFLFLAGVAGARCVLFNF